jgi:(1->4)-alpha-D-glucan 1-alpha-D-glucosylmutase
VANPETRTERWRELGIDPRYRDAGGIWRDVPETTLSALADALDGHPRGGVLPPVLVLRGEDTPLEVCIGDSSEGITGWEIVTEAGACLRGDVPDGAQHVTIPDRLPLGYHRFALLSVEKSVAAACTLIVAPHHAYVPEALQSQGRLWGITVQLYSWRSARNWGIGDFTDLGDLIERAAQVGASAVGLNPMHALYPEDPEHASPYSPSSRNFLNAIYIDPDAVADCAECEAARELRHSAAFQDEIESLRLTPLVDYSGVAALKRKMLALAYRSFHERHLAPEDERGLAFRAFQQESGEELRAFATFQALSERFAVDDGGRNGWQSWPEPYRDPQSSEVAAFQDENLAAIEFAEYLQWIAGEQLAACRDRAQRLGMPIGLYLDIAVGVDVGSSAAWARQDLYVPGWSIGAPPDAWNQNGQNWGLVPPYPRSLREGAYRSIRETLSANMRFAGAVRLDHIMGLERLFWIPDGAGPLDGAYVHYPLEDLLAVLALESHRNHCLVIGEDLGTVPDGLRETLADSDVLSYRLIYFEHDDRGAVRPSAAWPRKALVAATTHDLPPIEGYWCGSDLDRSSRLHLFPSTEREGLSRQERQRDMAALTSALRADGFAVEEGGSAPLVPVYGFLARTPSMLVMMQFEDPLGLRDQANMPGTVNEHPNWRRKLPLQAGEIFDHERVKETIEAINAEGRASSG